MGASTPRHHFSSQPLPLLTKKILTFALYALIPLALLHYFLSPPPPIAAPTSSASPPDGN